MKKLWIILLILTVCSRPCPAATGPAGLTWTVSWEPVTTNADGTLCSDLAGYKVYTNGTPTLVQNNVTQVKSVIDTTTWFAVTAYDTAGNESSLSEKVWVEIIQDTISEPPVTPAAPDTVSPGQVVMQEPVADPLVWSAEKLKGLGMGDYNASLNRVTLKDGKTCTLDFEIQNSGVWQIDSFIGAANGSPYIDYGSVKTHVITADGSKWIYHKEVPLLKGQKITFKAIGGDIFFYGDQAIRLFYIGGVK